jgi:hypothetical protein
VAGANSHSYFRQLDITEGEVRLSLVTRRPEKSPSAKSVRWALGSAAMLEAVAAFFGVMSAGIFIAMEILKIVIGDDQTI